MSSERSEENSLEVGIFGREPIQLRGSVKPRELAVLCLESPACIWECDAFADDEPGHPIYTIRLDRGLERVASELDIDECGHSLRCCEASARTCEARLQCRFASGSVRLGRRVEIRARAQAPAEVQRLLDPRGPWRVAPVGGRSSAWSVAQSRRAPSASGMARSSRAIVCLGARSVVRHVDSRRPRALSPLAARSRHDDEEPCDPLVRVEGGLITRDVKQVVARAWRAVLGDNREPHH